MDYLIVGTHAAACAIANGLGEQGHSVTLTGLTPPACATSAQYFPLLEINPSEMTALFTFLADNLPQVIIHMLELIEDELHRPERKSIDIEMDWLHRSFIMHVETLFLLSQQIHNRYCLKQAITLYCLSSTLTHSPYATYSAYSYNITKAALHCGITALHQEWQQRSTQHHVLHLPLEYEQIGLIPVALNNLLLAVTRAIPS